MAEAAAKLRRENLLQIHHQNSPPPASSSSSLYINRDNGTNSSSSSTASHMDRDFTSFSQKSMASNTEQQQQHQAEEEAAHDGLSFPQFMIAGSIAGMVEHIAMFPIDTLKTRTQMMTERYGSIQYSSSLSKVFSSIIKSEGLLGLYRGVGAMALGAGPAHAVYFSVYEFFKEKMGGNKPGHHPLSHAMAGILATVSSDAVFTPMDVVKQRLQLPGNSYRGLMDCIGKILRNEGIKAFYASYRTTIVMNAPYTATHFATYEAAKGGLKNVWPDKMGEERIFVHLTAGGAAGALASIVTTPLDVVKTRLQCQVKLYFYKKILFSLCFSISIRYC